MIEVRTTIALYDGSVSPQLPCDVITFPENREPMQLGRVEIMLVMPENKALSNMPAVQVYAARSRHRAAQCGVLSGKETQQTALEASRERRTADETRHQSLWDFLTRTLQKGWRHGDDDGDDHDRDDEFVFYQ